MITMGVLMDIRSLRQQGWSYRAIALKLGIHRKTVKRYLEENRLPEYQKRGRVGKLEMFKPMIDRWLQQENYQATRIHELLRAQGYSGAYPTVRRYVATLKETRDRVAYVRFETMPGQQAQVDFGDFKIVCADGRQLTIYCFVMVLGFSRKMYVEFIDRCTMARFLQCHQKAFEYLGGVPAEILYDNMRNVVVRKLLGAVEWNPTFMLFCAHYGFTPKTTPAYSPWAKGKVERPIQYIRERFWRGYGYQDLPQANKDMGDWNRTVAEERVHGTTHEKVSIRYEKERGSLGLLPRVPYDISEKHYRKVYKDCQLSFLGNRYVVPHEYVEKTVTIKTDERTVRIYFDDRLIAEYAAPDGRGQTLGHPHFYERLKADQEQLRRKYRKPFFKKARATRGLVSSRFMDVDVMVRPLSFYDALTMGVAHG